MKRPERSPRLIARQMALGFGSVSVVAVAMCAALLAIIYDVSGLVAGMRHDETSIRQGLELATAVRELSIHIANTVIEADESQLSRYEEVRNLARSRIQALSARVPRSERWRLQALGEKTQRMHDLLMASALPAAQRGQLVSARSTHREVAQLGREAAAHADALARVTASQMAHAHVLATDATRLGLVVGGLCVVLVVALSIGFTVRLRGAVLKPLVALTEAARRIGRGDFDLRIGRIGGGELAAVGEAFDRMADELASREARLLHSERMAAIGQLAAGVAHELNNPIGIIRGYLKTMTPDADPDVLREELSILDEEASQCQRIAEDLLSYARSGDLMIERIQTEAFLAETLKRFGETPAASGVELELDAQDATIEGDGARLRQVLLNLLTNASQASPAGMPIHVRGRELGGRYRIEVQDRGPGIAPADRERIFEPFFSRRRGGSGLGLAVCAGIIEAHHGSLRVVSGQGGGAVFRVELPLRQAGSAPPDAGHGGAPDAAAGRVRAGAA